jgi:hypothetical protein
MHVSRFRLKMMSLPPSVCLAAHFVSFTLSVLIRDMLMVELGAARDSDCPGAQVIVGDTAILWGPVDENDGDGLVRLQDIASTLKTTQSALTCGLDNIRISRQYIA